jgi:GT2 family glycosyltransferase
MATATINKLTVFGRPAASLQIQSVLFNNSIEDLERTVKALSRSCELAISAGALSKVVLRFGDCSTRPTIDKAELDRLRLATRQNLHIDYHRLRGNVGSARGHNELAAHALGGTDFLWIQNPDVLVSPRLFEQVLEPFLSPGIGQVEAKQLPIENPKDYDPNTGETDWTATACVMTPLALFRAVDGFDAKAFFLYCDDVDLSFRIRELGLRLIFQPAASCFHDKRLGQAGEWVPSDAEQIYGAEGGLMMAHKWSWPDLVEETLKEFEASSEAHLQRAARIFLQRRAVGSLPEPRDPKHEIGKFYGHYVYTKHRYRV